jgi:hypothetical protein
MAIKVFLSLSLFDHWLPKPGFSEDMFQIAMEHGVLANRGQIPGDFVPVALAFQQNFYAKMGNVFGTGSMKEATSLFSVAITPFGRFDPAQRKKFMKDFGYYWLYFALLDSMSDIAKRTDARIQKQLLVHFVNFLQRVDDSLLSVIDEMDADMGMLISLCFLSDSLLQIVFHDCKVSPFFKISLTERSSDMDHK